MIYPMSYYTKLLRAMGGTENVRATCMVRHRFRTYDVPDGAGSYLSQWWREVGKIIGRRISSLITIQRILGRWCFCRGDTLPIHLVMERYEPGLLLPNPIGKGRRLELHLRDIAAS